MSLFGGDEDARTDPDADSDFTISTIDDNEHAPSSSYAAQLDGTRDSDNNADDDQEEQEREQEQEQGQEQAIDKDELEQMTGGRSPSAISDTSDDNTDIRPNRFRGSDRAWLHHTEDDRILARSLDQLRANDLSLHLYNAHHLKARLRNPAQINSIRQWSRKSRWVTTDQDGNRPWYPDQDWSAWPLSSDIVPTGNETFGAASDGLDAFTLKNKMPPKLSHDLEQQLHAVILSQAHEMWKSRNPSYSLQHEPKTLDHVPTRPRSTRSVSAGPALAPSSSSDPDLPLLSSIDQSVVSVNSSSNKPSQASVDAAVDTVVKSEDNKPAEDEVSVPAVFSADDDYSHGILHPTVRHIMTKLDNLLVTLHQSREAQTLRTKEVGDTSDSSARSTSRSRSRSSKTSRRQSTPAPTRTTPRRIRSTSRQLETQVDNVMFDDSGEDETYKPTAKPEKRKPSVSSKDSSPGPEDHKSDLSKARKSRDNYRLGLRDWSEVLGIAALSGWDPLAVERARQRCQSLLGEDMQLFSLPEYADSSADEGNLANAPQPLIQPQNQGWHCPITNCFRNLHPLKQGFRWREHMRTSHKYEKDQIARLEEQLVQSGAIALTKKRHTVLSHNPRGWQPPNPLKCPDCQNVETVYPKVNRLLDHVRRTHKYDPRVEPPPEQDSDESTIRDADATSNQSDSEDSDSDDYMVGGVHNDGFLQPVLRHAGVRGEDQAQRLKRSNIRRSKMELKDAKKRRLHVKQPPSHLSDPDAMDTE